VKEFALEMAKDRAHKFTRVGGDLLIACEGNLKEFIRSRVSRLPSVGKNHPITRLPIGTTSPAVPLRRGGRLHLHHEK